LRIVELGISLLVVGGWGLDTQAVSIPFHKTGLKNPNISQNFT